MDVLQTRIGSFTLLQILLLAGGALVLLAIVRSVASSLRGTAPGPHQARRRCASCGWTGTVSKHKPRCGTCGSTSLEPA